MQPPSAETIFQWERSIYPKQNVSLRSVAFGTKLILRWKKKREERKGGGGEEDEYFDNVEVFHLGLS